MARTCNEYINELRTVVGDYIEAFYSPAAYKKVTAAA